MNHWLPFSPEPAGMGPEGKALVAVISWSPLSLPRMTPMSFSERLFILAYFSGHFHITLRPFPYVGGL